MTTSSHAHTFDRPNDLDFDLGLCVSLDQLLELFERCDLIALVEHEPCHSTTRESSSSL